MEGTRVLVLDDEPSLARSIARLVEPYAEPILAASVQAAGALLAQRFGWAAFIIDVGLPDGNGLDVLERFRGVYPRVPALVLTGYLDAATVNRATDLKASYIVKGDDHDRQTRNFVIEATSPPTRVDRALEACAARCDIPDAELDVLRRYLRGQSRIEIAEARGTSLGTVRKQIETLRRRARAESLDSLVVRILLEAIRD